MGVNFLEFCHRMKPFARKMKFNKKNSRRLTPLRIQFYCHYITTQPTNTFFNAWQWHQFDFGIIFGLFCFLNWLFAAKFSNCSNSLNFEAKINCNSIKPNVPKWRKTCTGIKFDLLHFYRPQSHILSGDNLWGPCILCPLSSHRRRGPKRPAILSGYNCVM